jgi:hypothetical protein
MEDGSRTIIAGDRLDGASGALPHDQEIKPAHLVGQHAWLPRMFGIRKNANLPGCAHGDLERFGLSEEFSIRFLAVGGAAVVTRRDLGQLVESAFCPDERPAEHSDNIRCFRDDERQIDPSRIVSAFMQAAMWGTPETILNKLEERRAIAGGCELAPSFRFGGTSYEWVANDPKPFAKEVLPVLPLLTSTPIPQTAE